MNQQTSPQPQMESIQGRALPVGIAALIALVIGGLFNPQQFFQSYLLGYLFWLNIALGSLGLLALHNMSGGEWGFTIRRLVETAIQTIPLMAVLFIPVLLGLSYLYIWADPQHVAADPTLQHKSVYLNVWFFIARAILYFGIWITLGYFFNKWSLEQDETANPHLLYRLQDLSGPGLILYGLTSTFATIDWLMSLEPHWYSTIFGLLFIVGQVIAALAFMTPVMWWLSRYSPLSEFVSTKHFHDLGNLLLAFIMLWAYMSFSQYLLIWSANLPEEIPWYLHRTHRGWQWMTIFLLIFHFAVPFIVLLSRMTKRTAQYLVLVAAGLLFMRYIDLFWVIVPSVHQEGFHLHWMDLVSPITVGGFWVFEFMRRLKTKPLLPLHDARLEEVLRQLREAEHS